MAEKTAEEKAAEAAAKAKADADEALAALTAQVEEANTKREAAEKLMRKTAAELQKLQTARTAAVGGLTEVRLMEITAEAEAQADAKYKDQIDEAAKLKAQNRALVLDADMKARALKAGVLPTKVDDFWGLRGAEFDLTADGKPMVKATPTLDVDKHLAALLKRNPEWVKGTGANGGGASGGAGGPGAAGGITYEQIHANPGAVLERLALEAA